MCVRRSWNRVSFVRILQRVRHHKIVKKIVLFFEKDDLILQITDTSLQPNDLGNQLVLCVLVHDVNKY